MKTEIRQLSRESAPDVDAWIKNAQTLQEDIEKSKKLAADIVRQAEADDARAAAIADKELHVDFLQAEIAFNAQLVETLNAIKRANDSLDETIRLATEDRIAAALESLQGTLHRMESNSRLLTACRLSRMHRRDQGREQSTSHTAAECTLCRN